MRLIPGSPEWRQKKAELRKIASKVFSADSLTLWAYRELVEMNKLEKEGKS